MKEFKGTKGEWELRDEKEVNKHGVDFLVIDFDGVSDCIDVYSDMRTSEGRSQLLPNAKLIAAAPELLKALQSAYRCSGERNTLTKPVLDEMLNAINKALN